MLPNRWHRAAIGAAGMYVELVLASICTFLWWFSEPGPLNYICLNVMFISSVSTLMFNANPLLRYDGYYILSDLAEIPNLRQKSSTILNRKLGAWFLGLEEPPDPFLPQRRQWLFAIYTVASAVYRWVVTLSILYFLNKVFEPYGLKILGQLIAAGALYGLLIQPLWKVYKFFKVPGRLGKVKRLRVYATILLLGGVIAAIMFVPLPAHVYCPFEVQARHADSVYVEVEGVLDAIKVEPGQTVTQGDLLAQLRNADVEKSIVELTGKRNTYEAQLVSLQNASLEDNRASGQVTPVAKVLASTKEQLAQALLDRDRLSLKAPRDGTVLPPPLVEKNVDESVQLPTWSGSPLERENLGATLTVSDKLCQIGNPNQLEARIVIDQGDVEFIAPGQTVEMMMNQSADYVYVSKIEIVDSQDLKVTPTHLSSLHGGALPTQMDANGVPRPLSPIYEAVAPLPAQGADKLLRIGLTGQAKISIPPRTLWDRLWRYLSRTFNFEL
jgi:putative peptide zinc metalloprotease protein